MNVGKLLGKAIGWGWKKVLRPALEERAARAVVEALERRRGPTPENPPEGENPK